MQQRQGVLCTGRYFDAVEIEECDAVRIRKRRPLFDAADHKRQLARNACVGKRHAECAVQGKPFARIADAERQDVAGQDLRQCDDMIGEVDKGPLFVLGKGRDLFLAVSKANAELHTGHFGLRPHFVQRNVALGVDAEGERDGQLQSEQFERGRQLRRGRVIGHGEFAAGKLRKQRIEIERKAALSRPVGRQKSRKKLEQLVCIQPDADVAIPHIGRPGRIPQTERTDLCAQFKIFSIDRVDIHAARNRRSVDRDI